MSSAEQTAQEEVSNVAAEVAAAEKNGSPVKKPAAEVEAGNGEESRDSAVSAEGNESAEGDEEEEVGEEGETDEDSQHAPQKTNGHSEKNGHNTEAAPDANVELANGEAKSRKRTSGGADGVAEEDAAAQKKMRVEDEQPAEPEVQAAE